MAVSKSRKVLRIVLVLVLLGVLGLGWLGWQRSRPESLWSRAQTAIEEDRTEEALLLVRGLLQKAPDHAEGHLALARLLLEQAREKDDNASYATVPAAMQHLAKAAELRPDDAETQKTLLKAYSSAGQVAEAGRVAEAVLKLEPDNTDALAARARAAIAEDDYAQARSDIKRLLSLPNQPTIRTLALQADLYRATDDTEKLQQIGAAAVERTRNVEDKVTPEDLSRLGRLLELAIATANDVKTAHHRMDVALQLQENRAKFGKQPIPAAVQAVRLAKALVQAYPDVEDQDQTVRAKLLGRVLDLGDQALQAGRARPDFHGDLVGIAIAAGDDERTIHFAEKAIAAFRKRDDVSSDALIQMRLHAARFLVKTGKYRSAGKHIEQLKQDATTSGWGHLLAGIVAHAEGRYGDARNELEQARRKMGSNVMVRLALARTLVALQKWREAVPYLQSLLGNYDKLPKGQQAWAKQVLGDGDAIRLMLVRARLALGDTDGAKKHLTELRGAREEAAALALQVVHLWNDNRRDEARQQLAAARNTFPYNVYLAGLDVQIRLAGGETEEAEQIVRTLVKNRPDDLAVRILEYRWLMTRRDYPAALKLLSELQKKFPDNKAVLLVAEARTRLAKGDNEGAAKVAAKLREIPAWKSTGEMIGAVAAMRTQDMDAAASFLQTASGSERRRGALGLLRGNLELLKGETTSAVKSFAEGLKYTRLESRAGASVVQTLLRLSRRKDPAEAEAILDEILKDHPRQPALVLAKAELQVKQGRFADALRSLQRFEQLRPESAAGPFFLARFYTSQRQFGEAAKAVKRAIELSPRSSRIRQLAAQIALADKRYDDALAHADAGLKIAPQSVDLSLVKVATLRAQKRTAEAEQLLVQLTGKYPRDPRPWLVRARLHFSRDENDKGLSVLADARSKNPENATLSRESIVWALRLDQPQQAEAIAAKFAGDKPDSNAAVQLAAAFLAGRRYKTAQQWADKAADLAEDDKQRLRADLIRADVALSEGLNAPVNRQRLEDARKLYADIHKQHPDNIVAANNLAWLLVEHFDDADTAGRVVKRIRDRYPLNRLTASTVETMLDVYLKLNDRNAARKLLDKAIRLRPMEERWLQARVNLAVTSGNTGELIDRLNQLKRQRPFSAAVPFHLARLLSRQGKNREAVEELNEALRIAPTHRRARLLAIEIHRRLKNHQAVLTHTDALIQSSPDEWQAYRRRAEALKALDRDDESQETLSKAINRLTSRLAADKQPKAQQYIELSRLYQAAGRPEDETRVLQDGLKKLPGNSTLAYAAIRSLLEQQKADAARKLADEQFGQSPSYKQALQLGRLFNSHEQASPARRWAEQALELAGRESRQVTAHWLLGDIEMGAGNRTGDRKYFEAARDHYQWVLDKRPDHLVAGNNLAWILANNLDAPDEAVKIVDRLRGDTPPGQLHVSFVDTAATVYRKAGKLEEARILLEQAVEAHPQNAKLHFALGLVYADLDRSSAATRLLRKAIQLGLSPDNGRRAREKLAEINAGM